MTLEPDTSLPVGVLSDARKEQIKLRATFLNGMGIGVILIGVFTPLTRMTYAEVNGAFELMRASFSPVICFILGTALHFLGTRMLGGLSHDYK